MNCFRHETAPLKAKIHLHFKMTREKIILYTLKNVINSHHPPPPPPLSFSPLNNSEMAKEAVTLTFLQQSVTFC